MPINQSEYCRKSDAQWKGVRVISLRSMRNGYAELPAGTKFTIERKYKGFELVSDPCARCGIKLRINRVNPDALEIEPST